MSRSIDNSEIRTVAQLRALIGKRDEQPLRELGLHVERIDPYGICRYCQAKVGKDYNCCVGCADEHGP